MRLTEYSKAEAKAILDLVELSYRHRIQMTKKAQILSETLAS